MKKSIIVPAVLLSTGLFLLGSCGNSDSSSMKAPLSKQPDSGNSKQKNDGMNGDTSKSTTVVIMDAKSKTIDNMQAAYKGETTASAKYAAYSRKAEEEGFHEIALLFKAASMAENIHANNHKSVLQESGETVPVIKPEFTVLTTRENLEDAIKGETYEASVMYPEFITTANDAGNQLALISLNYAYKTEKKHKVMYETALTALQNNTVKTLPIVFYVCPTCGNTYENSAPARCGISMTSSERFIKITSLNS